MPSQHPEDKPGAENWVRMAAQDILSTPFSKNFESEKNWMSPCFWPSEAVAPKNDPNMTTPNFYFRILFCYPNKNVCKKRNFRRKKSEQNYCLLAISNSVVAVVLMGV